MEAGRDPRKKSPLLHGGEESLVRGAEGPGVGPPGRGLVGVEEPLTGVGDKLGESPQMTAESPNGAFSRGFSTTLGCPDEVRRSASSPDPGGVCEV